MSRGTLVSFGPEKQVVQTVFNSTCSVQHNFLSVPLCEICNACPLLDGILTCLGVKWPTTLTVAKPKYAS